MTAAENCTITQLAEAPPCTKLIAAPGRATKVVDVVGRISGSLTNFALVGEQVPPTFPAKARPGMIAQANAIAAASQNLERQLPVRPCSIVRPPFGSAKSIVSAPGALRSRQRVSSDSIITTPSAKP